MKTRHVFEEHLYFDRLVGLLQGSSPFSFVQVICIYIYIYTYTPVFKNFAISKHVYHIYNYTFSAPVSFLSAPEKTYMHIQKKKLQVMATTGLV